MKSYILTEFLMHLIKKFRWKVQSCVSAIRRAALSRSNFLDIFFLKMPSHHTQTSGRKSEAI